MKEMPLDKYAEWMMDNGWYDIDPETGVAVNCRTGRVLYPSVNTAGYVVYGLVFSRKVVRQVKAHRMVAIKSWGVEAIRGKQVGHLDGNRADPRISNLWLPETARDHVYFDGTHQNLQPGKPKDSWDPCARCGEPNGRGVITPDRITGRRFGIDGKICRSCYGTLQERERRKRKRINPLPCHGDVLAKLAEELHGIDR